MRFWAYAGINGYISIGVPPETGLEPMRQLMDQSVPLQHRRVHPGSFDPRLLGFQGF